MLGDPGSIPEKIEMQESYPTVIYIDILNQEVAVIECDAKKNSLREILGSKKIVSETITIDGSKYSAALSADQSNYLPSVINEDGKIIGRGDIVLYAKNPMRNWDITGLEHEDMKNIMRHIQRINVVNCPPLRR